MEHLQVWWGNTHIARGYLSLQRISPCHLFLKTACRSPIPFQRGWKAFAPTCTKKATALSRPQAISGLGGVGKTQIAVEYAYRYRDAYRYVLWANAATRETLIADYTMLASRLHLPQQNEPDQGKLAAAVMRWLSEHSDWLLILDNADDLDMTCSFLPSNYEGHVLMTTRESATGGLAQGIEVREMDREEGTLMLLRRAKLIGTETALDAANSQVQEGARAIVVEMGGLPLALDQA